ncbi:hypothetical protein K2173_007333 [Erythroxylum novogranatense]|uniref:DUF4408 domain-containing protein n=1 Tax=Erythroxylum novogranatense TaxID=1862640 RepID=A0AAV8T7W9_9ROSI|nr:hypothetical protein K2173_007333 [Erythroxylum novogranatense]
MSSFDLEKVKAEKADAIRTYKIKRNFSSCLQVAAALVFLSWPFMSIPQILGKVSTRFPLPTPEFYVFLLLNVIVLLVYHSSSTANNATCAAAACETHIYDQYVSLSLSTRRDTTTGEYNQLVVSPALEITPQVPPRVRCNSASYAPVAENFGHELAVTGEYVPEREGKPKHYIRTRSELSVAEERTRQRKLRRSETENGRKTVAAGDCTEARKSIEEMNNEEFRRTIESFIASKKKILMDENNAFCPRRNETTC